MHGETQWIKSMATFSQIDAILEQRDSFFKKVIDLKSTIERVTRVVDHAKTKRACAEHYQLLLRDLLTALEGKK